MRDKNNFVVFGAYDGIDGTTHYGCRGVGQVYEAFYDWANTRSYKCVYSDFPWDYFTFMNQADKDEFVKLYEKHFIE